MIVSFFLKLSIRILWWLFFEFLVVRKILIQCFYFSLSAQVLSAVIVNKKNEGCCSWHCCRGIFCPYFLDATLLAALLQKRSEICQLFFLGLRAIHIKFKTVHQRIFFRNSRENLTIIALQNHDFFMRSELQGIQRLSVI